MAKATTASASAPEKDAEKVQAVEVPPQNKKPQKRQKAGRNSKSLIDISL